MSHSFAAPSRWALHRQAHHCASRHILPGLVAMHHAGGPFRFPFGDLGPGTEFGGGGGRGGPRGFRGPGGKARRGDVRTAALLLLADGPRNGYTIMQDIEERSGGVWRPSPGSVYPALAQLEDEGLIRSEEVDGRKVLVLTEAGRAAVAERPDDAPAPWDTQASGVPGDVRELFGLLRQLGVAAVQLAQSARGAQLAEGKQVLADARRAIYRILADSEHPEA